MTNIPCYKSSMDKDSLKVHDKPMDYTMQNSDMISGSILQINFKKLLCI